MACIYPGCVKAGSYETSKWNVGELCVEHYQDVKRKYGDIPLPLAHDFVKVHVLLQFNTAECLKRIKQLEEEMSRVRHTGDDPRFSKSKGRENYLKLSRALEYYEGFCWFPANRVMFTGVLKADDFYKNVKYGFNKDPGAGPIHGDQSHRLQWHVIMRCMTNNFETPIDKAAGWNNSPLGLFYEYTLGGGSKTGAWATSMDRRENRGWGNPDNVAVDIIKSGHTLIAEALKRRIEKMGGVNIATLEEKPGKFQVERGIPNQQVMKEYAQMKTAERTGLRWLVGIGSQGTYEQRRDAQGNPINVLTKKDAPDRVVEIDQARVNQSEGSFNFTQYTHGDVGAQPVVGGRW